MSSSSHVDNKKYILTLFKGHKQGLQHTLAAEKLYLINFTKENTNFGLSLPYTGRNNYLFITSTEVTKVKAKYF